MATKEKWVELFEQVVGRKPTMQEFQEGKATDFAPVAIRRIAGLTENSEPAQPTSVVDQEPEVFYDVADEDFASEVFTSEQAEEVYDVSDEYFSAPSVSVGETKPLTVETSQPDNTLSEPVETPVSEQKDLGKQTAWLTAFEKYVGRKPAPQEFQIGKQTGFDLTAINQFVASQPAATAPKQKKPKWKVILVTALALLVVLLAGAYVYGAKYFSREAVAERYIKASTFDKALAYEVWDDTNKPITKSDLKYTNTKKVEKTKDVSSLLLGSKMKNVGNQFLIFPNWKVVVKPVEATLTSNTKGLAISINNKSFGTTDSTSYKKKVTHLYPGTYNFEATGKVDNQEISVSSSEKLSSDETVNLDVEYLSFTVKSNLSDGDLYIGTKKVGTLSSGKLEVSKVAVTGKASVYVQKKFDDTTLKSKTTSISSISDGDTVTLDADGVLDRDTADDLVTAAYSLLGDYASSHTTPSGLTDVFKDGNKNSMYTDVVDMIETNTTKAKNRSADSITFSDVDVTTVTQTGANTYKVDFTVVNDFYYAYNSKHNSSGDIKDKTSWSVNVEYDDDSDEGNYRDYRIVGKAGNSSVVNRENTVK